MLSGCHVWVTEYGLIETLSEGIASENREDQGTEKTMDNGKTGNGNTLTTEQRHKFLRCFPPMDTVDLCCLNPGDNVQTPLSLESITVFCSQQPRTGSGRSSRAQLPWAAGKRAVRDVIHSDVETTPATVRRMSYQPSGTKSVR
jgi:hypothetical protein